MDSLQVHKFQGPFPPAIKGQGFGEPHQSLEKLPIFEQGSENGLPSTHSDTFMFWEMSEMEMEKQR